MLLLDDRTSEGQDLQLQSLAHGVVSLEHSAPAYGRALRHLRVVKFRGSDFRSGFHHMRLHAGGVEVFPRLSAGQCRPGKRPGTKTCKPGPGGRAGCRIQRGRIHVGCAARIGDNT